MRGAPWRAIRVWRPAIGRQSRRDIWTLSPGVRAVQGRWLAQLVPRNAFASRSNSSLITNLSDRANDHQKLHGDVKQLLILNRAPHGINSLGRLAFESDLGHSRDQGSRLTDLPVNRQDLDLWLVLLEYRILKDGTHGIREILHGMKFRGTPVKLLDYDNASDRIWELSLTAAIEDPDILFALCDSREGIGRDRPTLFYDIVGPLLTAGKTRQAENAATALRKSHFRGKEDLLRILDLVLDETSHVTLDDFCAMYRQVPRVTIYAEAISALCKARQLERAMQLHKFLLNQTDFPATFGLIEPLIRHIAQQDQDLTPFLSELESFSLSFSAQARQFYARVKAFQSGTTIEAIDLGSSSVRQRRLNDQFAARVFATHALSFEFALKSLKFFGLVEIGPLAVRELAVSAGSIQALKSRFSMLEALEIDTGSSTFVSVVRNLCDADSAVLLAAVLASDQHHDVFEDQETQKRLLSEYYYKKDWPQINRTLAILNRGKTGPIAQQQAQHFLLKSAIVIRDWRGVLTQLADISRLGHDCGRKAEQMLVRFNLDPAIDMILSRGKHTGNADKLYLDRVRYLIGVLQDMEFGGISVSPRNWRRILYRLGELSQWDRLERLSMWLGAHYGQRPQMEIANSQRSGARDAPSKLESLFDARFQAAVMHWSICRLPFEFETVEMTDQEKRGARLLKKLRTIYDVKMDRAETKELYRSRLNKMPLSEAAMEHYQAVFDKAWDLEMESQDSSLSQNLHESPFFAHAVSSG